jgi:hypothetical protein
LISTLRKRNKRLKGQTIFCGSASIKVFLDSNERSTSTLTFSTQPKVETELKAAAAKLD